MYKHIKKYHLKNVKSVKDILKQKSNLIIIRLKVMEINIDTFVSKRDPSDEEIEEGAKDCESFCNIFPPLFQIKILHQRCSF